MILQVDNDLEGIGGIRTLQADSTISNFNSLNLALRTGQRNVSQPAFVNLNNQNKHAIVNADALTRQNTKIAQDSDKIANEVDMIANAIVQEVKKKKF